MSESTIMNKLSDDEKQQIIIDESYPLYEKVRDILGGKRAASVLMALSCYMAEFSLGSMAENPEKTSLDSALNALHEQTMVIINGYIKEDPEMASNFKK
jgi:hypothetical protein